MKSAPPKRCRHQPMPLSGSAFTWCKACGALRHAQDPKNRPWLKPGEWAVKK